MLETIQRRDQEPGDRVEGGGTLAQDVIAVGTDSVSRYAGQGKSAANPRVSQVATRSSTPPLQSIWGFRREKENCRPSPHCLDLSRRYGFSLSPGCADLLAPLSFTSARQTIQSIPQKDRKLAGCGRKNQSSRQCNGTARFKPR